MSSRKRQTLAHEICKGEHPMGALAALVFTAPPHVVSNHNSPSHPPFLPVMPGDNPSTNDSFDGKPSLVDH